jgi:DNA-binding SARP family transcriptional activator/predicted ATPase
VAVHSNDFLRIELLGGFQAVYRGELLSELDTRRLQALLAYVALDAGIPQPRRQMAFTFWPESSEKQAFTNLRKLLHQLLKVLPDSDLFLRADAKTITWLDDAPFTLDVAAFEHALAGAAEAVQRADAEAAEAALVEAAEQYRGELLPGLHDDWILLRRERLHQRGVDALEELAELLEGRREYAGAIRYGERLIQLDPLREPSCRLLMRLYALNGDRAGALRVYWRAAGRLREELGVEPEAATRELRDQLRRGETPPEERPLRSQTETPLVGRQPEWERLTAAWRTASEGAAHLALVTGEAGIGKTRLAEELLHWASCRGLGVARSRAYAAEGRMVFAPIVDWLRSEPVRPALERLNPTWLAEVARLLPMLREQHPELPRPSPQLQSWQRPRLFEALARGLLASGKPLLLLLDDVQWCDPDTLEWLRFLLRFAPEARLLIIATVRIEEVGPDHALRPLLLDLGRAQQVTEVTLRPLDAADTRRLAEQVAQRELEATQAAQLFEETEGHPLFVVESVRAGLPTAGAPREPSSTPTLLSDLPAVPPSVQAVLRRRFAQLSPLARALAGLAAVVGRTFTFALLAAASTRKDAELADALDELWRRRFVREQGGGVYDFSHDKLRESAYSEIAPSERRLLHRRVAEALEAIHAGDPDVVSAQVAYHLDRGGLVDEAIGAYQRAAQLAQRVYANDEIVRLLERALELLNTRPPGEARDEQELTLLTLLGPPLVALHGYSATEATRHYERARSLGQRLGRPGSPVLRALASAYVIGGELERGHQAASELLELAQQRDDPMLLVEARYVLGISSFWRGRVAESRAHLEQALAGFDPRHRESHLALYAQDPEAICLSRLAWTLWYLGYPGQASRKAEESLALAHELGHPFSQAYALYFTSLLAIDQRSTGAATERVESLLRICRKYRFPLFELLGRILQAWLRTERGEVEPGIAGLQEGIEAMPRAEVYLLQSFYLGLLAQGHLVAGGSGEGLRVVSRAFAFIERYGERFFEAELHRIRGMLFLAQGEEGGGAEAEFHQAIAVARRQQAKSLELRAQLQLSRLWHGQGKVSAARPPLELLCSRFPEPEDAPELAEARALLATWS